MYCASWEALEERLKKEIFRFLNYLKENPGSGFIILFMILLITCAFLLIVRNENAAEILAGWAYLFLVVGVIVKIIELRKNK